MAIGVLHFVYAFRGGVTAVLWEILLAMVCAVAGFCILANTSVGLESLTFVIALSLRRGDPRVCGVAGSSFGFQETSRFQSILRRASDFLNRSIRRCALGAETAVRSQLSNPVDS